MVDTKYHLKIKKTLFFVVVLLLWLPYLQKTISFYLEPSLGGVVTEYKPASLSIEKWLNGEYQKQTEEYQKNSFGFRNTMIRLNNQKLYSLFDIAKANGAIVGKEGYLLDEGSIYAYTGQNFVGDSVISFNVKKLSEVKEQLNKLGKDVIFVIAPSKGSFLPEYIPDKFVKNVSKNTNYGACIKALKANNIDYLDFKESFIKNKNISQYPLFPKCGIHWSKYGEYVVADSLIKHIERLKNINLPSIILDSLVISRKNLFEDYDIAYGMNLLYEIEPNEAMAYPYFHFETKENEKPIKALVVADSFYWGLFNKSISYEIFDKGEFWYYNKQIYSWLENGRAVEDVNLKKRIDENDLFILLFNESNLLNFDYGFTTSLHNYFYKNLAAENKRVDFFIDKINTNTDWLNQIKEESKKTNRPLSQLIIENAMFMVRKEQENN